MSLVESPLSAARNTILLITIDGYERHAAAPISRSFINRLYNCAGKCAAAVKYRRATRIATTNADNYRGRWISIAGTPMKYRRRANGRPRNCGKSSNAPVTLRLVNEPISNRPAIIGPGALINKRGARRRFLSPVLRRPIVVERRFPRRHRDIPTRSIVVAENRSLSSGNPVCVRTGI